MSDKVLIVMTSGPDTPRRCATPFYMASLAVAMDDEAYIYFTIDGILLLKRGVAETVYPKPGGKPVSEFLREAREAGVHFLACTAAADLHGMDAADMVEGVQLAGGATMLQLAEEAKTVLSY